MAQVFISHSKEDDVGRAFFDRFFGSCDQHKGFWYSWEGPQPPHSIKLRDEIKKSKSIFVILSKGMETPHTRIWIGYEVGLAAALEKKVWIFEPENQNIDVPVPFVTGYIKYNSQPKTKQMYPFHTLVENAGLKIPRLQFDPRKEHKHLSKTHCYHQSCLSEFYAILDKDFKCPICKKDLEVKTLIQHILDPMSEFF